MLTLNTRHWTWLVLTALALNLISLDSASAERQNWKQQKERFIQGSITDSQGNQWDVILIPGAVDINKDAVESWKRSGRRLGDLFDGDFWDDIVYGEFKKGLKFSRKVARKHFWNGIRNDFKHAKKKNQETKGQFGHVFFSGVRWVWFGTKATGRTVWLPIGTTLGVSYSLVAPVGVIVWKPVGSALDVSVLGSTWPVILYVWNGTSWTGTVLSPVPSRKTWLVRLQKGPDFYEIDRIGFDALLHGSVLQFLTDADREKLQEQIDKLQQQLDSLRDDQDRKDDDLRKHVDYEAMQQILEQAWRSDLVDLADDARVVYLDDARLQAIMVTYLEKLGVEDIEEERLQRMIEALRNSVENILKELSKKSPARR